MKGITPVLTTIMLVMIAVGIVALAYSFILGFWGSLTNKMALVYAAGQCDPTSGAVTLYIKNTGNDVLNILPGQGDITATRTQPGGTQPTFTSNPTNGKVAAGGLGTITENADGTQCRPPPSKATTTCLYDVVVSGNVYKARADCF